MKIGHSLMLFPLFFLAACESSPKPSSHPRRFTEVQLQAKFPADLGQDEVDVSSYPSHQNANYTLYAKKCSQCHTLARSINAPFIEESTWTRYVHRMHGKAQNRFEAPLLQGEEARRVIDFLTYDSRERKVKRAQEFMRYQEKLKELFEEVQAERSQQQREENTTKARESAPYVGDKP